MSPRSLTVVVALPCFKSDSDRGNLGLIVKRKGEQAQRRLSQEVVTKITFATDRAGNVKDEWHLRSSPRMVFAKKKLLRRVKFKLSNFID